MVVYEVASYYLYKPNILIQKEILKKKYLKLELQNMDILTLLLVLTENNILLLFID